jgi:hypothetical protein
MPIVCKWAMFGEQQTANFETIDEMIRHPVYNDFTYINMNKCGATHIPNLPPNLQILMFNDNKIFNLPRLPETLHSLVGTHNRISKFPEIAHCPQLEDINFFGNDIEELNTGVPPTVKTIDIDFNRLRWINYDLISPDTKITAAYNFITQPPPDSHILNVKFDHNNISDEVYRMVVNHENRLVLQPGPLFQAINRFNFDRHRIPTIIPQRINGTDNQSVHNSSIQASANKSLDYVLHYDPKKPVPNDIAEVVTREYCNDRIVKSFLRRVIKRVSPKLARKGIFTPPIRQWVQANDIHSQFGVTYKTLLKQVWAIIEDHEHAAAIKEVLFQELDDSRHVCFTGRFTRTLNALTGFIEQVQIGINSREQMQNHIAMIVKKTKERLGTHFQEEARKEVKKILEEFNVPEPEHLAWLDAID